MASLFQVELPPDIEKARETVSAVSDNVIGNAAGDAALLAIQDTAEKTKAVIDAIIASVEEDVQAIADEGIQKLYDALGLNEEIINFARNIVSIAMHGADLAGSAVLKGMNIINSMDMNALPMSAVAAGLSVAQTFADKFVATLIERYGDYAKLAIEFVVDPDAVIEQLMEQLDIAIQQVYDLIDEQVYRYLGMSIAQIRKLANEGLRIYKEYKAARKRAREKKDQDGEEGNREGVIEGSGKKTKVNVKVTVNADQLKQNLMVWLSKMGDAIFNGFLVLQVLDAINSIRELTKTMTDINLESLAEDFNSLEDLIALLDELGFGDDSTAIDLSLIPSLNINAIIAQMNSIVDNFDAMQMATGVAKSVAGSIDVQGSVSQEKTYDLTTDVDSMTINITFYNNPQNGAKNVYKTLKKAKDSNDKRIFSESELKTVTQHINKLENNGDTEQFKCGKYTFVMTLKVDQRKQTDKERQQKIQDDGAAGETAELETREEVQKKNPDGETRRNTIAILHTAFSILKSMVGVLQPLMILVNNYKINKAYARSKHDENLVTCFMDALSYLGMGKKSNMNGDSPSSPRLYTVRTYALYRQVVAKMHIRINGAESDLITDDQKRSINKWLKDNEPAAKQIPDGGYTKLYIDMDSILEEQACKEEIQQELLATFGPGAENISFNMDTCIKVDGTFDGIDNIEMVGDYVIYSDSTLPRLPSQIMWAIGHGFKDEDT